MRQGLGSSGRWIPGVSRQPVEKLYSSLSETKVAGYAHLIAETAPLACVDVRDVTAMDHGREIAMSENFTGRDSVECWCLRTH